MSVAREEVIDALAQGAPSSWVQLQAERLIDYIGPYVAGRSDGFSTEITLTRNKEEASKSLTGVAVARLRETLMGLPVCETTGCRTSLAGRTRAEATAARRRLGRMLPDCIPPEVSDSEIIEQAEAAIVNSVQTLVFAPVPDTITFTESHLRSTLERSGGPETLEHLDRLRAILNEGWSYSEGDLRADLSERGDALQALDGVRSFLGDGYSHTYGARSVGGSISHLERALDRGREQSEFVRRYQWIAYVAAPFLLAAVGFLGGAGWRGRIVWMSSTLLISAILIFLLSWPMQDVLADTVIKQSGVEVSDRPDGIFQGTSRLLSGMWVEVIEAFSDEFAGGIRQYSLALAGIAAAVLLTGVFWHRMIALVERLQRRPNLSLGGGVR